MAPHHQRATPRTYVTCTWAERQMTPGIPLWLDGARWSCLALSDQAQRRVGVQPDRCATCPHWLPRPELVARSR